MRPRKPFWPKSLLVRSAHLQGSDAYRTCLRIRAIRRLLPDPFGLVVSQYDEYALTYRGELVFPEILAVFPSGLEAWVPLDDQLESDVQTRLYGLNTSIAVHLAVPSAVLDGPNVSPEGKGARSTRYIGAFDAEPPGMRPKIELVFDDDSRDRYERSEVLRLGRVERAGAQMRFTPTEWPAVLHANACPPMLAAIRQVLEALTQRKRELLSKRTLYPFHLLGGSDSSQDELDLLVVVSRQLAALRTLMARRTTPPYRFYEHLRCLYLSLASYEEALEQPPSYRHDGLGSVFPWFVTRICNLLERVARDDITYFEFARADERGLFTLAFHREDLPRWKRPILVAHCPDNPKLLGRLPEWIKMAAPARIEGRKHSAAQGVRIRVEDRPPRRVPNGDGIQPYTIVRKDDTYDDAGLSGVQYWDEIMEACEISIYLNVESPSLQFYLYCVDQES